LLLVYLSQRKGRNRNARTEFPEEKKSINLPTVNGMLIDTADEVKSSPTAMSRGFFSGFARAAILPKDEALSEAAQLCGRSRESIEGFVGRRGVSVISFGCVEYALKLLGSSRGTKRRRAKVAGVCDFHDVRNRTWRQLEVWARVAEIM
jgi:hypothetical protein